MRFCRPLLLIFTVLLALGGCNKLSEESYLALSVGKVVLVGSGGGTVEVAVRSSEEAWQASSEATWLKVQQQGQQLLLVYEANGDRASSKAKVVVFCGDATRELQVEQLGSPLAVELSREVVPATYQRGREVVQIKGEVNDWEVTGQEAASKWLTVENDFSKKELVLVIEENKDFSPRDVTLTLSFDKGSTLRELRVQQEGGLLYLLPYMKPQASEQEVEAFETARGSQLLSWKKDYIDGTNHPFLSRAKWFDTVEYDYRDIQCDMVVPSAAFQNQGGPLFL